MDRAGCQETEEGSRWIFSILGTEPLLLLRYMEGFAEPPLMNSLAETFVLYELYCPLPLPRSPHPRTRHIPNYDPFLSRTPLYSYVHSSRLHPGYTTLTCGGHLAYGEH